MPTDEDQGEYEHFGDRRGELRYGVCTVRFRPIPALQDLTDHLPFYVPNQSKEVSQVQALDQPAFWQRVLAPTAEAGRLTAFVHGYNIGFRKSCRRAAIFQSQLNLAEQLILFSWPSRGRALNYTGDETDLAWSVRQIQGFLQQLVDHAGQRKLNLIGHSLGARGLVEALEHLACSEDWQAPPINELILVAPDIDSETFAQQLARLRQVTRRITLYVSDSDKPLRLSQEVHGYPRLGQAGSHLTLLPGVETIDVSDVAAYDLTGHQYHLYLPQVANDMGRLLGSAEGANHRPQLTQRSFQGRTYWAIDPGPSTGAP
jgi:esterase/lipase superfamily enzyme